MSTAITAAVVIAEVLLGGTIRRDLLGSAARGWLASAVPLALIADHGLLQLITAVTGVALLLATLWSARAQQPPMRVHRRELTELLRQAERNATTRANELRSDVH